MNEVEDALIYMIDAKRVAEKRADNTDRLDREADARFQNREREKGERRHKLEYLLSINPDQN
jgi:hypothetical protein